MGFEGGCENPAIKRKGDQKKNTDFKLKGGSQKNSSKFCSDSICNNIFFCKQPTRMAKTSVSDIQKVLIFPGKHAPGPPTLLRIKKQLSQPTTKKKAYQLKRLIREKCQSPLKMNSP